MSNPQSTRADETSVRIVYCDRSPPFTVHGLHLRLHHREFPAFPPHLRKKLLRHHVAHASFRAAQARVVFVLIETVAVVVSDFLARLDATERHNPNLVAENFHKSIRCATVVQVTRRVPVHLAINVGFIVEGEDVTVVLLQSPRRFLLGDSLADILDERRVLLDFASRKTAHPVNPRVAKLDHFLRLFGRRLR